MKPINKPDPKLVHLGEDVPWVWGVDGARGELAISEENITNISFVTKKEYIKEYNQSSGPAVQRSSGPAVQRSSTPGVVCHEGRPTGSWRTSSGLHAFNNRLPVQG